MKNKTLLELKEYRQMISSMLLTMDQYCHCEDTTGYTAIKGLLTRKLSIVNEEIDSRLTIKT